MYFNHSKINYILGKSIARIEPGYIIDQLRVVTRYKSAQTYNRQEVKNIEQGVSYTTKTVVIGSLRTVFTPRGLYACE